MKERVSGYMTNLLKSLFVKNCCDGVYNSFDVHFTSACDNRCAHCIDLRYDGIGVSVPNVKAIAKAIIENHDGYDDVLFLGGEPCLYLQKLVDCVKMIKANTSLKLFVTTAVPKICHDRRDLFCELLDLVDGMNLSVQHWDESVADRIRKVPSRYDRQKFYGSLPNKDKIRINLNIVKPFLYTKEDILNCLKHYDKMGFNEIKLSEIQHGKEYFVSFEKTFGIGLGSPYCGGCQKYVDLPEVETPVLLKRSCFMCEETLRASPMDAVKVAYKAITGSVNNKYAVVYEDGSISNGWR